MLIQAQMVPDSHVTEEWREESVWMSDQLTD